MSSSADPSLIYPRMKAFISRVAHIALISCWASSICALLIWLPLPSMIMHSLGDLQLIFLILMSACLGILLPWCHLVLAAESGFIITRLLSSVGIILSILTVISFIYSLITQEALITNQGGLPLLIALLILITSLVNMPYISALALRYRIYLPFIPLLYIICYISLQSRESIISTPSCLLLLLVSHPILHGLKRIAPRIISLPPRKEKES